LNNNQAEDATMKSKQAARGKTNVAAMTTLGVAGLGLSLVGSAASATPTADIPQSENTPPDQRFVLGDEEMADVSLATFHLFDKEHAGALQKGDLQRVAWWRGCRGCGWRACRCGGCGGCCARWGRCRWC
jgi:hypothetical protein